MTVLATGSLVAFSACDSNAAVPTTVTTTAPATTTSPSTTTVTSTTSPSTTSTPVTTAPVTTAPATTTPATTTPATTMPHPPLVLSVYFLRGERVGVVHRTVPYTVGTSRAALLELLGGPNAAERSLGFGTAVPAGTTLNGVSISAGIATVDLSGTFESGGGSLSLMARLAQLVFTVTQFPSVNAVLLKLDGAVVELFGGEGIMIDGPLTRAWSENMAPAVLVESPAPFDRVSSPVRVWGSANTFEATFMLRITDPAGVVLYEHFQTATSGSGTRGTFDVSISITPTVHGTGMLRAWSNSPEDGHEIDVVEIPLSM